MEYSQAQQLGYVGSTMALSLLNILNVENIEATYQQILDGNIDWLSLRYSQDRPEDLSLDGFGSDGLPELKGHFAAEDDQAFIAFLREPPDTKKAGYVLINYIPRTISIVRRARVLVHSRRVGQVFSILHGTLTIDHLSNLTPTAIHKAVANTEIPVVIELERSSSDKGRPSSPVEAEPVRRSFSEMRPSSLDSPSAKVGNLLNSLLRRKPAKDTTLISNPIPIERSPSPPPPIPPKDGAPPPPPSKSGPRRSTSDRDFTMINLPDADESPVFVSQHSTSKAHFKSVPLPDKWNVGADSPIFVDPAERARRRQAAQRQREVEEEQAIRDEEERQLQIKARKRQQAAEERREEAARRASLESDLARAASERRRRETLEKLEEHRKTCELEEKKRQERERRAEEHKRLEAWRKEKEIEAVNAAKEERESRKREQEDHKRKVQAAETKVRKNAKEESLNTGWVTLQTGDSLVWKRRYFKVVGSTAFFYRTPKETAEPLDKLDLRGHIRALREWYEGFEELKSIPQSFAIEFTDDRDTWAMFSDSEEDKYKLLGLLYYSVGLKS